MLPPVAQPSTRRAHPEPDRGARHLVRLAGRNARRRMVAEAGPGPRWRHRARAHAPEGPLDQQRAVQMTVNIIRNRVAGLGVSGATVQTQGSQIIVQIPGMNNGRALEQAADAAAQLYFRPVICFADRSWNRPAKRSRRPLNLPGCTPDTAAHGGQPAGDAQTSTDPKATRRTRTSRQHAVRHTPSSPPNDFPTNAVLLPGPDGRWAGPLRHGARGLMTGPPWQTPGPAADRDWRMGRQLQPHHQRLVRVGLGVEEVFHEYMAVDLDGIVQSARSSSRPRHPGPPSGQVVDLGHVHPGDANTLAPASLTARCRCR